MSESIDWELLRGFVAEGRELLDEVEPTVVTLAESAGLESGQLILHGIFRLFHSMKGASGMLGLNALAGLTHRAETLLDALRSERTRYQPAHEGALLACMDLMREILDHIEATGREEGFDDRIATMVATLSSLDDEPTDAKVAEASAAATTAAGATTASPVADQSSAAESRWFDGVEGIDAAFIAELRARFVLESDETLELIEQSLLRIETGDTLARAEAFRHVHSFKGSTGILGLGVMQQIAHRMESLLGRIQSGEMAADGEVIAVLLRLCDSLREGVADVAGGGEGRIASGDLIIRFLDDQYPGLVPSATGDAAWARQGAGIVDCADAWGPATVGAAVPEPDGETCSADAPSARNLPAGAAASMPAAGGGRGSQPAARRERQDIRVDLGKLDSLLNLVGELAIADAMLTRHPLVATIADEGVERAVHQLQRVSRELQDVAMAVRMVPLGPTFQKMHRLVRDLATKLGKKVELQIAGEDTEVDKSVIEWISDPLVHLVRNALDHGLETPEQRRTGGKTPGGVLRLEGRHEAGEVWISIADDGAGLDRGRILQRAAARGLLEGDGSQLPDARVWELIFEPGFSTAEAVTDTSGRGVGMDVVRRNVERIKGRVTISTRPGQGTTFVLHIPLTLAIIQGMLVRVASSKHILPMSSIRESSRAEPGSLFRDPDGRELVRIREDILPVVRLVETFGLHGTPAGEDILVVIEEQGQRAALLVDELLGQQETVVKGLSTVFGRTRGVSGCTILGSGEVGLILDVPGILARTFEQRGGGPVTAIA